MSVFDDRLYNLLPAIYRIRDNEQGEPLRSLLSVIAEQVQVVESDIGRLYDDWFIETCDEWVVPYIADLIGYRMLHEAGETVDLTTPQGRSLARILVPRKDVAHTLRNRRRKGTLALLELIARDVAGWPARAVEYVAHMASNASVRYGRAQGGTVDIARAVPDLLDGPFDTTSRTADVRQISSLLSPGRHGPENIGLFVWRLRAFSVTRTPAYCVEGYGNHCYTFSALGNDTQLFAPGREELDPARLADESTVPRPIRRRAFEGRDGASPDHYGEGKSLAIEVAANSRATRPDSLIPRADIVPADLRGWTYRPRKGQVAVDPVLGRIAFAPGEEPESDVWVSYFYGFSADLGGGEYERRLRPGALRSRSAEVPAVSPRPGDDATGDDRGRLPWLYRVSLRSAGSRRARAVEKGVPARLGRRESADTEPGETADAAPATPATDVTFPSLDAALDQWHHDVEAGGPSDAIIELADSDIYDLEQHTVELGANRLELRAAPGARPVLRLIDRYAGRPDPLLVRASPRGRCDLDGILLVGRGLEIRSSGVDAAPGEHGRCDRVEVNIRHSTLVPGWSLDSSCRPHHPAEPSLTLVNVVCRVTVSDSIIGTIRVVQDEVTTDPSEIHLQDSILDATDESLEALDAPGVQWAHAVLVAARTTIIGKVLTHAIDLGENTIFLGVVRVARTQRGCLRFCYVPPGSRTPRRFRCQPDGAAAGLSGEARRLAEQRVRPIFNSTRYGTPAYCQLALDTADAIGRGADDRSEMGVFHNLFQPQRAANLQARLDEHVPASSSVGIVIVT
jgi:hypothetical protein